MSVSLETEIDHSLVGRYQRIRQQSLDLCSPLETEDYQIQPMVDASPPKWHLAHVTWFFETFLLKPFSSGYVPFNDAFEMLFNSYYNSVGQPFTRAHRGFLSRPTLQEVLEYRQYVDRTMTQMLQDELSETARFRIEVGLHHEQQHQELILTDIKYNFGNNPLKPVYSDSGRQACAATEMNWVAFDGGLVEIGVSGSDTFVFDNETPRHQVFLIPYQLASHLVTNGEYLEFIEDGGYSRADLWLSDGWSHLQSLHANKWHAPLYWRKSEGQYYEYALSGEAKIDPHQPVCHVSAYEADAYARWKGCRLPTEAEWEHASVESSLEGNFVESGLFHPSMPSISQPGNSGLHGLFGDVWEWTGTSYAPYPGYQPFAGQLGEYNGKFMANQLVLRGGSCATPASHIRPSYRNFFYPPNRWQFSGIRLAKATP